MDLTAQVIEHVWQTLYEECIDQNNRDSAECLGVKNLTIRPLPFGS